MEKVKYESPEAEIICFEPEDVITKSTETPEVGGSTGSTSQPLSLF